jgi:hypothetical protein
VLAFADLRLAHSAQSALTPSRVGHPSLSMPRQR